MRFGESLAGALEREMREETGLRVRVGTLFTVYERLPEGPPAGDGRHYVVLDYVGDVVGGSLRPGDDAADVGWFSLDELDGLNTTPGLRGVLESAF